MTHYKPPQFVLIVLFWDFMVQNKADKHRKTDLVIPQRPEEMPLVRSVMYSLQTSYHHVGRGVFYAFFATFILGSVWWILFTTITASNDTYFWLRLFGSVLGGLVMAIVLVISILSTTAVYLSFEASKRTVKSKVEQLKYKKAVHAITSSSDLAGSLQVSEGDVDAGGQISIVSEKGALTDATEPS